MRRSRSRSSINREGEKDSKMRRSESRQSVSGRGGRSESRDRRHRSPSRDRRQRYINFFLIYSKNFYYASIKFYSNTIIWITDPRLARVVDVVRLEVVEVSHVIGVIDHRHVMLESGLNQKREKTNDREIVINQGIEARAGHVIISRQKLIWRKRKGISLDQNNGDFFNFSEFISFSAYRFFFFCKFEFNNMF